MLQSSRPIFIHISFALITLWKNIFHLLIYFSIFAQWLLKFLHLLQNGLMFIVDVLLLTQAKLYVIFGIWKNKQILRKFWNSVFRSNCSGKIWLVYIYTKRFWVVKAKHLKLIFYDLSRALTVFSRMQKKTKRFSCIQDFFPCRMLRSSHSFHYNLLRLELSKHRLLNAGKIWGVKFPLQSIQSNSQPTFLSWSNFIKDLTLKIILIRTRIVLTLKWKKNPRYMQFNCANCNKEIINIIKRLELKNRKQKINLHFVTVGYWIFGYVKDVYYFFDYVYIALETEHIIVENKKFIVSHRTEKLYFHTASDTRFYGFSIRFISKRFCLDVNKLIFKTFSFVEYLFLLPTLYLCLPINKCRDFIQI